MVPKSQKPNLKLNLSLTPPPPPGSTVDAAAVDSPARGYSPSSSSCLSSREEEAEARPMVVAGCQRCLMYVMLAVDDLRCPKCGSLALVHFFHGGSSSEEKKNKSG